MRCVPVVVLMVLVSSAAIAQTSSSPPMAPPMAPSVAPAEQPAAPSVAPSAAPSAVEPAPEGILRDDYIAKARAAAEKRAAAHFDAMDANHDGILTKAEIAAYRAAHRKKTDDTSQ